MISAIISFFFFLFWEAFFALSEISFVSAEKALIEKSAKRNILAKICLKLWKNPERFFTVTVLGVTLSITGNGVFTSYFLIKALGNIGILISSIVLPVSMLFFGQIVPKTIGKKLAFPLVLYVSPIIYIISFVFFPIIWINQHIMNFFLKTKEKENPYFLTKFREIFLNFIHYEKEIDYIEKKLMEKIVEFGKKKVSQVMIPISQVKALPITAKVNDALEFNKKYGFSYIPLFERELVHIKYVVKIKDLIGKPLLNPQEPLIKFAKTPVFVPEIVPAHEVLSLLQKERKHIAIVVDEYGYATGLITIEDLVEEVLGEFRDALDYYVPEYKKISDNVWICKAYIEIEKLQSLGINIPSGDYETLAGFIYFLTNRIPSEGEVITYNNLEIKILKAKANVIEEVLIKKK